MKLKLINFNIFFLKIHILFSRELRSQGGKKYNYLLLNLRALQKMFKVLCYQNSNIGIKPFPVNQIVNLNHLNCFCQGKPVFQFSSCHIQKKILQFPWQHQFVIGWKIILCCSPQNCSNTVNTNLLKMAQRKSTKMSLDDSHSGANTYTYTSTLT